MASVSARAWNPADNTNPIIARSSGCEAAPIRSPRQHLVSGEAAAQQHCCLAAAGEGPGPGQEQVVDGGLLGQAVEDRLLRGSIEPDEGAVGVAGVRPRGLGAATSMISMCSPKAGSTSSARCTNSSATLPFASL